MRMQHSNANTINKKSQPRRFDFPIIGSLTITLNSGVNMRSIENGGRVEWVLQEVLEQRWRILRARTDRLVRYFK